MQTGVITGTPTRVVLLCNMVGPGEVDPDLEDEVANECSKYGQVQSVMIFEVTTAGFPDDQAVRIFVEFERMEQAVKVRHHDNLLLACCHPYVGTLYLMSTMCTHCSFVFEAFVDSVTR